MSLCDCYLICHKIDYAKYAGDASLDVPSHPDSSISSDPV
jgi:hypothetical protein